MDNYTDMYMDMYMDNYTDMYMDMYMGNYTDIYINMYRGFMKSAVYDHTGKTFGHLLKMISGIGF